MVTGKSPARPGDLFLSGQPRAGKVSIQLKKVDGGLGSLTLKAESESAFSLTIKGMKSHFIHKASVIIINFASRLLSERLLLSDKEGLGVRHKMRKRWITDMQAYPKGTPQQFYFAMNTICAALKLNVVFRESNKDYLERDSLQHF
jgi:hypothetical protein